MPTPDYRLRIFLSVDLAGSTAFKNGHGAGEEAGDPFPRWVSSIRHFYRNFPLLLSQHFRRCIVDQLPAETFGACPSVWKSIGDELLFCARLRSHEHLACCVTAFLKALDEYGKALDIAGKHMDVKGAGWVAAFPAPNVTVTSTELSSTAEYLAEDLENQADITPSLYDFLGKDIDSGFRVARHASSDRFVASVELAWLLSEAQREQFVGCTFGYHGRHILKGVIRDRPYPVISIDTERSATRRDVRQLEKHLVPSGDPNALNIRNFCAAFMNDEGIEFPALNRHGARVGRDKLPESYLKFEKAAQATLEENARRQKSEKEAGEYSEEGGADIPAEVQTQTDLQVKNSAEDEAP